MAVIDNLLDTVIEQCSSPHDDEHVSTLEFFLSLQQAEHILVAWINLLGPEVDYSKMSLRQCLQRSIADIDQQVEEQLNVIIHHRQFQALEARWRGLKFLVDEVAQQQGVKIKLLDVSWQEVCKDIDRAVEFDQSHLFRYIYNEEFGMPGGEPYGLLLGDYYITHKPSAESPTDDINALKGMAQIAAASFAPFICAAAPQLFGLDAIEELTQPIDLERIFSGQEYIRWRALRDMEDSRFLAITVPGVLLREPYQRQAMAKKGLYFEEYCHRHNNSDYLWGNAAIALGLVAAREFGQYSWFSTLSGVYRGHLTGGVVTQFPTSAGISQNNRLSTPVVISDSLEKTLSDEGFIPLCHSYGTPFSVFHSSASLQKPKKFSDKSSSANARVSAMLQQIMCASRFAHYIKVLVRDKIGSFQSEKDAEELINNWLRPYATGRTDLDWELRARYPLRDFKVQVRENYNKPGTYGCTIHLKPHFVAEQIVSELKLTTELVQTRGSS
ncbi:MAG: type VI secretion system protein ImpD [Paraglaciecola psychrophila]